MARIPAQEIERLKSEIAVERLVEACGVALKPAGKDLIGRCPFHEDREGSLVWAIRGFSRSLTTARHARKTALKMLAYRTQGYLAVGHGASL